MRPVVVEFAGTPRAGKTVALKGMAERLTARGCRVSVVEECARVCPLPRKRHPHFNLWTVHTTIARMLEAANARAGVVLVDRGLFDAIAWMYWFRRRGALAAEEHAAIDRWLRSPAMTRMIDLVVVMTVEPSEAVRRERGGGPPRTPGPIVNPDTLAAINESLEAVMDRNRRTADFRLEHLDTTGADPRETLGRVARIVDGHLDRSLTVSG